VNDDFGLGFLYGRKYLVAIRMRAGVRLCIEAHEAITAPDGVVLQSTSSGALFVYQWTADAPYPTCT
jgi:hypothetical protein